MARDWLLVETLGDQPVVVAEGRRMENFVPLTTYLRRDPGLAAIQTAIAETVGTGNPLASITPKNTRVIRTEPVQMSDGRIYGVHVWFGPPDAEPPERPIPGRLKWDLTSGEATATPEFFANAGLDPDHEEGTGRTFADDIPTRSLTQEEIEVLARMIEAAPERTYCSSWEFIDPDGESRRVGFTARTAMEPAGNGDGGDGDDHLVARAMNLVEKGTPQSPAAGPARPGVYRLLADLDNWSLVKWIDDPCPYFNWRGRVRIHPDDYERSAARMSTELEAGTTSAVLRLPDEDGSWVPIHVTVSAAELDEGGRGGVVSLRLPTEDELAEAGLDALGPDDAARTPD